MLRYLVNLIFLSSLIVTCNNEQKEINKNVKLNLIDSLNSYSLTDGWQRQANNTQLKIVVYINGTCGKCVADLSKWEKYISEISHKEIGFVFYLYSYNTEQIIALLNQINFTHPVIIDTNNAFYNVNKLSNNIQYQAFLLNKENEVLIKGNPIFDSEIKNAYFKEIGKCINLKFTTISFNNTIHNFGNIQVNDNAIYHYSFKNTGKHVLLIQNVRNKLRLYRARMDKTTHKTWRKRKNKNKI